MILCMMFHLVLLQADSHSVVFADLCICLLVGLSVFSSHKTNFTLLWGFLRKNAPVASVIMPCA